jgi:hypothetical protein
MRRQNSGIRSSLEFHGIARPVRLVPSPSLRGSAPGWQLASLPYACYGPFRNQASGRLPQTLNRGRLRFHVEASFRDTAQRISRHLAWRGTRKQISAKRT